MKEWGCERKGEKKMASEEEKWSGRGWEMAVEEEGSWGGREGGERVSFVVLGE